MDLREITVQSESQSVVITLDVTDDQAVNIIITPPIVIHKSRETPEMPHIPRRCNPAMAFEVCYIATLFIGLAGVVILVGLSLLN